MKYTVKSNTLIYSVLGQSEVVTKYVATMLGLLPNSIKDRFKAEQILANMNDLIVECKLILFCMFFICDMFTCIICILNFSISSRS